MIAPTLATRTTALTSSLQAYNTYTDLELAIFKTLIYASTFRFAMTAAEIHHFLIEFSADLDTVIDSLSRLGLESDGTYYTLSGNADHIEERQRRAIVSEKLWTVALRWGRHIARLPFVRMVALTGSLAMKNAYHGQDDIDFMIVTSPHRVWITRAFTVGIVKLAALRGTVLCPNYVVDTTALRQERQDLFIAHEIAQAIPLSGQVYYAQLRAENPWVNTILPNADRPFYVVNQKKFSWVSELIKRFGERVFGGWVGNLIEKWEQRRKVAKFAKLAQTKNSSAKLDATQVKGHFNDHGFRVLEHYQQQLVNYGLIGDNSSESTSPTTS